MTTISNHDDIIDSRDVIERIEELEANRKPWFAGWNMPGYMPDCEPAQFETSEEAREYLAEVMESVADEEEESADDTDNGAENARELREAAEDLRDGSGEYGCTVGAYHFFVEYDEGLALPDDEAEELRALRALEEDAEGYAANWRSGEMLIRDSYFKEYAQQLAEDIGAIDPNGHWPLSCIDWDEAARQLQEDYTAVDFDGVTYWVRC